MRKKGQTKRDETRESLLLSFFNLYLPPARQDSSGERSAVSYTERRNSIEDMNAAA